MARPNAIIREGGRWRTEGPLLALLCLLLIGLIVAPPARAAGRSTRCGRGAVRIKIGKKPACVPEKLALPPAGKVNPVVARVQGALVFTQLSFKTPSGRQVRSFPQVLGKSWATAQGRLQNAVAGILKRVGARRPSLSDLVLAGGSAGSCAVADAVGESNIEGGSLGKGTATASIDGVDVTMGIDSSGMHLGMSTTVNGDKVTMKYDSGEVSCLAYELPPCPQADGSLDAFGLKGKTGFSLTVQRGGKVLKRESYQKTITVETKGKVAADAKLDYVDVKYGETTNVVLDGTRLTQYGNRATRIDMRNGGKYDPGESVSFGNVSAGGESANVAGVAADAKDFGSFVAQTISAYQRRQDAWQTPNACARLKLDPAAGTLTVAPGDHGGFSGEVDATADGARAAAAEWTLSGQQNGTFSPGSSKDPAPTFSYDVTSNPSGETLSVVVKATSSAGVAQQTWSQKLNALNKISGTFNGHEVETSGVVFDWSGTATYTRTASLPGGSIYILSSGQATVTVSGTGPDGCSHSGTETIQLAQQGVFTVNGTAKPYQYQVTSPWSNESSGQVTLQCPGPSTFTQTEIPSAAALQSGEVAFGAIPTGLSKISPDGITFEGSATENDSTVGSASWNWSLKASS